MPNYWTLVYDGTEKTLAAWGFSESAEGLFSHLQVDTFSLDIPGALIEDDPVIPFEGSVIIYQNRASETGATNSFSGGTIEFQGKRLLHVLDGRPTFEGVTMQFGGPWYDLDQTPYLQAVKTYTGDPENLGTFTVSEVVLFQKIVALAVVKTTNGEQITAILQSLLDQYAAQSMAAPFQIGTIDPAVNLPTYQAKDIKCSEAIQLCLRSSPDCKLWFDYTTTPPTCHVRKQANLTAATVALADGVRHESIKLTPRYDLQARGVTIYFKQTNSADGFNWVSMVTQQAGTAVGGLRGIIQTVDLQGVSSTSARAELEVLTVANNLNFWKQVLPEFASGRIRNFATLGGIEVKDDAGANVSLATYPNMLLDGSNVASWMVMGGTSVVARRATIKAWVSYDQYDADTDGRLVAKFPRKELHARVNLTNGISGVYSSVLSSASGEAVPANLAQNIYDALQTLQYQGTISLVESECSGDVHMGHVLNLTGGKAAWTTMRALVQQIHKDYGAGRTQITIGPASHLSAADLTQIFLVNRYRQVWRNPNAQASAQNSGVSSLSFGKNAPKENSNSGLGEPSKFAETYDLGDGTKVEIKRDAEGQKLLLQIVDAAGAKKTNKPSAELTLTDMPSVAEGSTAKVVKLQPFTAAGGGTEYVFATAPVSGGSAPTWLP
jgi:hypothetical protein